MRSPGAKVLPIPHTAACEVSQREAGDDPEEPISVDASEGHAPLNAISPELRAWCSRLYMHPAAVDGWAKMHVNPVTAMVIWTGIHVVYTGVLVYLYTGIERNKYRQ
jgi:hypothetical protein